MLPNKKNMKVIQKLSKNGEDIFGFKKIATRLNNNFVDMAANRKQKFTFDDDLEQYLTKVPTTCSFKLISCQDVKKHINKIARNKATGLDQIPASRCN